MRGMPSGHEPQTLTAEVGRRSCSSAEPLPMCGREGSVDPGDDLAVTLHADSSDGRGRLARTLQSERTWSPDRDAQLAALRVALGLPRALPSHDEEAGRR